MGWHSGGQDGGAQENNENDMTMDDMQEVGLQWLVVDYNVLTALTLYTLIHIQGVATLADIALQTKNWP